MLIKVTKDAVILPIASDEFDSFVVAGLRDARETSVEMLAQHAERFLKSGKLGDHQLADARESIKLIAAIDLVLEYYGAPYAG